MINMYSTMTVCVYRKAKDDMNAALQVTPEATEIVLELQRLQVNQLVGWFCMRTYLIMKITSQQQKSAYDAAAATVGRKMFERNSSRRTDTAALLNDTKPTAPGLLGSISLEPQASVADSERVRYSSCVDNVQSMIMMIFKCVIVSGS